MCSRDTLWHLSIPSPQLCLEPTSPLSPTRTPWGCTAPPPAHTHTHTHPGTNGHLPHSPAQPPRTPFSPKPFLSLPWGLAPGQPCIPLANLLLSLANYSQYFRGAHCGTSGVGALLSTEASPPPSHSRPRPPHSATPFTPPPHPPALLSTGPQQWGNSVCVWGGGLWPSPLDPKISLQPWPKELHL